MLESADEVDSKSIGSNTVRVQVPPPAPKYRHRHKAVPVFFDSEEAGLEGLVVNDCLWQSEPATAPAAAGQVPPPAPKYRHCHKAMPVFFLALFLYV